MNSKESITRTTSEANHQWPCGNINLIGRFKAGVLHNETEQTGARYSGSINRAGNSATPPVCRNEGEEVSIIGDIAQVVDQNGRAANPASLTYHGIFAGLKMQFKCFVTVTHPAMHFLAHFWRKSAAIGAFYAGASQ